jgi:L-threonylcarbamoyladenylate synthase
MKIYRVGGKDWNVEEIVQKLADGQVFIYPTDTVYGLGCDALDEESVQRIFNIKGRGFDKPLSVAFSSLSHLNEYVTLEGGDEKELIKRLPGPYTFIVRNKKIPAVVTGGLDTVGVRIPDYGPALEIIRGLGRPIITTSVNKSGQESAKNVQGISQEILDSVDFIIDGGQCGSGSPSRIIDLIDKKILR